MIGSNLKAGSLVRSAITAIFLPSLASILVAVPIMSGTEVRGQDMCATIAQKYEENSAALGAKTYPQGQDCAPTADGQSLYAVYENGNVYQINDPPAVMILDGPIMDKWISLGQEQGVLGLPREDQKTLPSGNPGEAQAFEYGIIFLKQDSGVPQWMMIGDIWDLYAELGREQGQLGYPISAPLTAPNPAAKYQQFESGYIYYSPTKGAYVTAGKDQSPSMSLPAAMTVQASDAVGVIVTYAVLAQDDHDPQISASCNPPSGFLFYVGTTTVTCTLSDSINAPVVGQFTITVKGDESVVTPPTTTPPATTPPGTTSPSTSPNTLNALIAGKLVAVDVKTSSKITNFIFDEKSKRLSFRAEGQTGTEGSTELSIGRVLQGPYVVTVDGRESTNFEITEADGVATIMILYTHSVHSITITGTNVVPEFPFLMGLIIVPALVAIIVITRPGRDLFLK